MLLMLVISTSFHPAKYKADPYNWSLLCCLGCVLKLIVDPSAKPEFLRALDQIVIRYVLVLYPTQHSLNPDQPPCP